MSPGPFSFGQFKQRAARLVGGKVEFSAFGKLPFYEDFLIHRALKGKPARFRDWLEAGFREAASKEGAGKLLRPRRFALHLGGWLSVAAVHDSTDKGGVRSFPFATWTTLKAGALGELGAWPLALGPLWEALEEAAAHLQQAQTVPEFQNRAGAQTLSALPPAPRKLGYDQVPAALLASGEHEAARVLFEVDLACAQATRDTVPERFRPVLRLPLPGGEACPVVASFWLDLLDRSGIFSRTKAPRSLMLPACGERGSLLVFLRDVQPGDFALLCRPVEGYLDYYPEEHPGHDAEAFAAFAEERLPSDPEAASLADLRTFKLGVPAV